MEEREVRPDHVPSFCSFPPRDPCRLEERLRYATQAAVALDYFLLAHLSRLPARALRAELMQDCRGPTSTPGLEHAPPGSMERLRQEPVGVASLPADWAAAPAPPMPSRRVRCASTAVTTV